MKKCTGINCPMQYNAVDPENCNAVDVCQYATPPITMADKIRAMSDEELAKTFSELADCFDCPAYEQCDDARGNCVGAWLAYLKSEV